ncbi:MAG: hypothetical protein Ta2A_04070 [Treponemataceae bacterium]|nr:MAG: hypothetical protein Ta2A_04070 [Treponemataceae bacterium]
MKKLNIAFILTAFVCAASLHAQDAPAQGTPGDGTLNYINVQIYALVAHKDAYIVLYAKQGTIQGYNQVTIPRSWARTPEGGGKLYIKTLPKGLVAPYMTIYYKGTEFQRVALSLPHDRNHSVYGIMKHGDFSAVQSIEKLDFPLN